LKNFAEKKEPAAEAGGRRVNPMTDDLAEWAYRAHMRALGRKGGAATRGRLAYDSRYYCEIGRAGGLASAIAQRRQIADELATPDVTPKSMLPIAPRTDSPAVSQPAIVDATGAVESSPKTAAGATLDAILEELNAPLKRPKQARRD
jgi:general stress protein YciG